MAEPAAVRLLNRFNPLVMAILRSPLHWILSPGLMLVTVTGRRTGRVFTLPVGYYRIDDTVIVMVSDAHARSWWRNFGASAPATLRIGGRTYDARGCVPDPGSPEFVMRAEQSFRRARFMSRIFGIDFDPEEGLRPEQVKALADYARIVVFELEEPESGSAGASAGGSR